MTTPPSEALRLGLSLPNAIFFTFDVMLYKLTGRNGVWPTVVLVIAYVSWWTVVTSLLSMREGSAWPWSCSCGVNGKGVASMGEHMLARHGEAVKP